MYGAKLLDLMVDKLHVLKLVQQELRAIQLLQLGTFVSLIQDAHDGLGEVGHLVVIHKGVVSDR